MGGALPGPPSQAAPPVFPATRKLTPGQSHRMRARPAAVAFNTQTVSLGLAKSPLGRNPAVPWAVGCQCQHASTLASAGFSWLGLRKAV